MSLSTFRFLHKASWFLVEVILQVLDENDNVPVFKQRTYTASVEENAENGTIVTKVAASRIVV